ncbi:MAG: M14 family metallopeptidase [Rikenellaceae bacterium]
MKKLLLLITICGVFAVNYADAQKRLPINEFFAASGSPANPKVKATWNYYRNLNQIEALCKEIAAAYPDLAKVYSIGKSYEGNEMWGLTISDSKSGDPDQKPGMMIFANIHSNEIQATTMALYTAWYLTEMHASNEFIQELLKDKTFYIVPTINPDAREYFMYGANTPHSPRAGMIPIDIDRDGYIDEDGYDDFDNDGNIVQMRRKSSNGRYIEDPKDSRKMIEVAPDQKGEYEILGYEGFDNDGDGKINEDGIGGYDPNRNFGYGWEPNYLQGGSYKYPMSIVENRNIVDFLHAHPNIGAGQTYHNSGGMILTPPGAIDDAKSVNKNDMAVYNYIASKGEEMIPGYKQYVIYEDLYTTVGSDIDYMGLGMGMFTYCNELYSKFDMFNGQYKGDASDQQYEFDKLLLFNDGMVDWKEVEHPQFGTIEVGGVKKNFSRIHPGFLLESAAHRNMAFTILHCYHTPKLSVDSVTEKALGGGLKEVTAVISNSRLMPTHSDWDLKNKISRPDWIKLEGANVVAGMIVTDPKLGTTREQIFGNYKEQKNNPEKLIVDNISGNSYVTVRWIISGDSKYSITVDSQRGGIATYNK